MNPRNLATSLLLIAAACHAPEGKEWKPTIGLTSTVDSSYDLSYDLTLSGLGYAGSIPVDFSMTNIEFGTTLVSEGPKRLIKHQFFGFALGTGNLSYPPFSLDIAEISAGGRYYHDEGGPAIPFLSIWSTLDTPDDPEVPSQLGLRFGGGVEFLFGSTAALTLQGDYLVPLINGEDSLGFQYEVSGFAIRFGIRFMP